MLAVRLCFGCKCAQAYAPCWAACAPIDVLCSAIHVAPRHACHAGVSGPPDEEGFLTYQRPEGKSGGHGVGWSEIPRYKFKVGHGPKACLTGGSQLCGHLIMELRLKGRAKARVLL